MLSLHNLSDIATGVVAGASVLYRILPHPDKFDDWPRFQGWYKFFFVFLSGAAINRSNKPVASQGS